QHPRGQGIHLQPARGEKESLMRAAQAFPRENHPSGEQYTAGFPFSDRYDSASPSTATDPEAELTSGFRVTPGQPYGFFTDTTLCIGCKACEVACKQWNNLP